MTPTPLLRRSSRKRSACWGSAASVKLMAGMTREPSDETRLISSGSSRSSLRHEELTSTSFPAVKPSLRAVNLGVSGIGPGQTNGCVSALFARGRVFAMFDRIGRGPAEMAMTRSGGRWHSRIGEKETHEMKCKEGRRIRADWSRRAKEKKKEKKERLQ